MKLNSDKDLCKNLWYELNPRVRCAFGNVYSMFTGESDKMLPLPAKMVLPMPP